ncbi:MAG: Methylated-DNA/protein-cysteine methyltransferase [Microgenomates group bacterium GW2011_GWC1_44_37]|uniref:Methylated-DNA/protein-cysteine methyltransferase n=1 Tax=Candidatus Collierbacteria bacterium GW2011_GWB2_44_22 TaxID=1618387 RepID=A0A0G1KW42_9BACT|nr:MAG: Methylated-DNA/protein-cysteine methyltransferase [Candidatus Collierbacteria bacterium GW2011_GWA2_44_13]KKT51081.1 MAG: Methylated-DNA/protein-cysteine methyltransferase [Candidatus Collierbacteria bacterium GW2011_GWB1_44_197]KKT52109.1 MAG: Methylated-DNA/protein-cysteine methyltransferase [Candidatus Collierbacteria bacterium GW2011_GWB2_44_22]KKT66312.1 MAG: Methylated-DNA/protein-cysteine methyltransferase [Candidatus Collierbacteria bacterium GW2011_GWC2_44_30]KKT68985.1 MAG: Me
MKDVPKGRVTTYRALGEKLGTKAYRAVGQALKNNPYAPEVPCHRVVRSDGSIGGFMGKIEGTEIERKISILESEGVTVVRGRIVDFNKILFEG